MSFTIPGPCTVEPIVLTLDESNRADDLGGTARPVQGSRARIWVESTSGERWNDGRMEDLWIVDTNPSLGGDRAYEADEIDTFVYTVTSRKAPLRLASRSSNPPTPWSSTRAASGDFAGRVR